MIAVRLMLLLWLAEAIAGIISGLYHHPMERHYRDEGDVQWGLVTGAMTIWAWLEVGNSGF